MGTYNRTTVIGNVGGDVVLRHTSTGKAVVNLSIATHEYRKEGPEETTWHRVVLWERLAELAQQYVTKGKLLYIEGPLRHREWVDNNGIVRSRSEINAHKMIFLGDGGNKGRDEAEASAVQLPEGAIALDGEERGEVSQAIPF